MLAQIPTITRRAFLSVFFLIGTVALRLTSTHEPFPAWSGDPLELVSTVIGITPVVSLLIDILSIAVAMFVVWRYGTTWRWLLFMLCGATVLFYHIITKHSLDAALEGSHWLASLCAAGGIAAACAANQKYRAIVVAGLVMVLPVLVLRGVAQVFIEHPQTVAAFTENKAAFFAAQGWTEDSPSALAYIRRLNQAEATGWIGLSNVYAGVCSAGVCLLAGIAMFGNVTFARVVCAIAGVMCGAGTILAGSKGGVVVAGVGIATLLLYYVADKLCSSGKVTIGDRLPRYAGVSGAVVVVVGVLASVAIRGVIGTESGERSILFRWYYLEGAARIFSHYLPFGTGPGSFREAYLLHKTSIAPEDVASPHSILFDYAATLGVGGLALGAVWFGYVIAAIKGGCIHFRRYSGNITHQVSSSQDKPDNARCREDNITARAFDQIRPTLRPVAFSVAMGVVGSALLESQIASPALTLVRVVGLILGGVLASAVLMSGVPRIAIAAGAIAIAAHAQIEMTLTNPGSTLWLMLVLGAAAGSRDGRRTLLAMGLAKSITLVTFLIVAVAPVIVMLIPVKGWQQSLNKANFSANAWRESKDVKIAKKELVQLRLALAQRMLEELEHAYASLPTHFPTARALSRMYFTLAVHDPNNQSKYQKRGLEIARLANNPPSAMSESWLATSLGACNPQLVDISSRQLLAEQIVAVEAAAALAPYETLHPVRLAVLLESIDPIAAAKWATLSLIRDEQRALDPILQLNTSDKRNMQRIAALGVVQGKENKNQGKP